MPSEGKETGSRIFASPLAKKLAEENNVIYTRDQLNRKIAIFDYLII